MAKKSKLPNGLRVVSHTVKGSKAAFVGVGIQTGNRSELDKEIGLSHALEHMLFKGTKTRTATELNEVADFVGSYANAFTSNEQTVYYQKGLRENLELSMEIIADQVFNSVFPAEEQKKEMEVIEQEIKRYQDDPNSMMYENFYAVAFKGNRLATPIIGNAEQVLSYTPEDMLAYYSKHYVPKNMVLCVVGNIKHKEVHELALKYFGSYDKPFKKTKIKTPTWNPGQSLVHLPTENQVSAMIGWELPGRKDTTLHERTVLRVLNTILSGGMTSKLFREIREKRGLVYSVGSHIEDFDDIGYLSISGGTDHTKLEEFLLATTLVLRNFSDELTDRDLTKAKNAYKANLVMSSEKIDSLAIANINSMQEYKKVLNIDEILAEIDTVTAEEVKAALATILKGKPVLSIYGNAPQLETDAISVEKFELMLNGKIS